MGQGTYQNGLAHISTWSHDHDRTRYLNEVSPNAGFDRLGACSLAGRHTRSASIDEMASGDRCVKNGSENVRE